MSDRSSLFQCSPRLVSAMVSLDEREESLYDLDPIAVRVSDDGAQSPRRLLGWRCHFPSQQLDGSDHVRHRFDPEAQADAGGRPALARRVKLKRRRFRFGSEVLRPGAVLFSLEAKPHRLVEAARGV